MKKIIYTVNVGHNDCFYHCTESQKKYAEKVGADFLMRTAWTDLYNDNLETDSEKRFIIELLKHYDKVLYLDADVYIKYFAENIYEKYKHTNDMIIYNEVKYNNVEMDVHIDRAVKKYNINWTKTDEHYNWYNAGVMLVSKGNEKAFEYNEKDFFKFIDMPKIYDMPFMHYNIFKYNIPITELEEKFNTMAYFHTDGDFLHFANVLDRNERIKEYV